MGATRIITNGLVLTLDKDNSAGIFNIVIKDGKIAEVDQTDRLTPEYIAENYPDAEITDAKNKLIMPGFVNSHLNSSTRLSKIFFKRNIYDSLANNISLDLLWNYFKSEKNAAELYELILYSYTKALMEGETSLVEVSECLSSEFYTGVLEQSEKIRQKLMLCAPDSTMNDKLASQKEPHFIRFGREDSVNTYSLNALKKYIDEETTMVCCDVLSSEKAVTEIKNSFGKSPVKIFDDYGILNEKIYFTNPVYITESDMELISEKKASVIFNTTDYIKLAKGRMDVNALMDEGVNILLGTGYLGNNILSEIKVFAGMFYTPKIKYSNLLRMGMNSPVYAGGSIAAKMPADIVMMSLEDARNYISIPDTDGEKIAEFIIENLSTKDIREVIINGESVVRDGAPVSESIDDMQEKVKELSEEIFRVGNYFEFKERYLMKKRVDELKTGKTQSGGKQDSYEQVPLEEIEAGVVDDGFRIVGVQKSDDYAKERPLFEQQRRRNVYLTEIKSFKRGLAVFSEKGKEENGYDEFTEDKVMEKPKKSENYEPGQVENKEGIKKIKFGFSEGDEGS